MKNLYLFDEKAVASQYGVGTYVQQLAECLQHELNVTVVYLMYEEGEVAIEQKEGVRYINIPVGENAVHSFDRKKVMRRMYHHLIYILSQYVGDDVTPVFHLNYTNYADCARALKQTWPESRVVVTVHYFSWCFTLLGNTVHFKRILAKADPDLMDERERSVYYSFIQEQELFQEADDIICLSDFARNTLIQEYQISAHKLAYIPNGLHDRYEAKDKLLLRKEYGISPQNKIILFAGRLDTIKGVKYLVDAFGRIAFNHSDIRLYIIGSGNFSSILAECKGLWEKISFVGRLDKKTLYDFYCMADVGVLPSMHEQCSYAVIEMLMHGLPVIGTTSTGLKEMISHEETGFKVTLLEQEDEVIFPVDELAVYLERVLYSPALNMCMSKQCRAAYMASYTIDRMKSRLLILYNQDCT